MSHRPRKRFGQHFLHDPGTIDRIIRAIDPQPGQRLVEIGPGLGAITVPLLSAVGEMDAIEIDRDAIRALDATCRPYGTLRLHEGDALEFDLGALRDGGDRLRVVGNLPYNISTPLIFHLIDQREHILDMHFMLQKEVVDRMCAAPGDDAYGRLTVMLAPWVTVTPLFDIGRGAFRPPPKVVSTFFRMVPRDESPFPMTAPDEYARIVAAAFAQRRKTLRNALKALLTADQIDSAGIDPGLRAEVVTPEGYARLASVLAEQ
ncbi:MAG TPA: 16S rRNA (adenine(1518)-N(6)/adenine(1519)-N(6))-dimethyltransferase RsmA [Steroidobacteraceae bacterium]|nr:16S rRNA (adenine(1518)-N(6)/adenine(1519)-N(6))-dimethyltransferase RsmA [Steroidobacteraceae bacterium]